MSESPWHRRVSPVMMLLLIVAGLMVGLVAYVFVSGALGFGGG